MLGHTTTLAAVFTVEKTTLVWLMVKFGVAELGREAFAARLPHMKSLATAKSDEALVALLLACAYQSTRNSGDVTRKAAERVAAAIGVFLTAQVFQLGIELESQAARGGSIG